LLGVFGGIGVQRKKWLMSSSSVAQESGKAPTLGATVSPGCARKAAHDGHARALQPGLRM
jgi:hypothetical protein